MSDPVSLTQFGAMMTDLGGRLRQRLGMELLSDSKVGLGGSLEGRVYTEARHFNFQYSVVKVVKTSKDGGEPRYSVEVRTGQLPRVNSFAMFFPLTRSKTSVRAVVQAARASIEESEGGDATISVTVDGELSPQVGLLVLAQGVALAALGAMLGYLWTGHPIGAEQGAAAGGVIGVGSMLFLILRAFD